MAYDVAAVRKDFPILQRTVRGKPLVYLDNAATTQKPRAVIEAMTRFYEEHNANVHRSPHRLGEEATELYVDAHRKVADLLGAPGLENIVFTKNTTESINVVAGGWARRNLGPDDEIVLTRMEHHSNLIPWQQVAEETGATIRWIPVTDQGRIRQEDVKEAIGPRARLVAVTHMSNVLGTITPAALIAEVAHDRGARVLLDAAQSVPHMPVDVGELGVDLLAFSGHKMCGPTGIGVLYGTEEALGSMEPFLFGGEMIRKVTYEAAEWNDLPWRFEAGTPVIAEGVGLGAAVDYLQGIGLEAILQHEREMVGHAYRLLQEVDGLTIYGPPPEERGGVLSFNVEGIHAHDLASLVDGDGVALRAGHHCAQPLMDLLGVPATTRASFYLYNTREEAEALAKAVHGAMEVFAT